MERVETDLNKSKQAREKQSREFSKQIEEERNQHERKVFIDKIQFSLKSNVYVTKYIIYKNISIFLYSLCLLNMFH